MTDKPAAHDLMDQYIDVSMRLERCRTLMRFGFSRRVRNSFYEHTKLLEETLIELEKALEGNDRDR